MVKNVDYITKLAAQFEKLATDMTKEEAEAILNMPPEYTPHMLRDIFRGAILKFHPDRNKLPDAHEMTKSIIEAYKILKPHAKENRSPIIVEPKKEQPIHHERGSLIDTWI
jgi:DnaJ-class molecular chaperone